MIDYKELYLTLFREVTTAIEILQDSQKKTEEMYIESGDSEKE